MNLGKRSLVALTSATLFYAAQIRMYTDPANRYVGFWGRNDGLVIVSAILLLALVALLCDWLVSRANSPVLRRAFNHLLLLALGFGLINIFFKYADYKTEIVNLGLAILITYSWCSPRSPILRWCVNATLILSPISFLLCYQLLAYPSWNTAPEPLPEIKKARPEATPIFLFVFDEWSYERSTDKGEFKPFFKNLRAFGEQSFVFHQNESPGHSTEISMPRLLFQTNANLKFANATAFWSKDGPRTPTFESSSLFQLARAQNYYGYLSGFHLPYRRLLGDQADYVASRPMEPKEGWLKNLRESLLMNLQLGTDPFSRKLHAKLDSSYGVRNQRSQNWVNLNHLIQSQITELVGSTPNNTFALFHVPSPHFPYIFNADGTYAGPYASKVNPHDIPGYMRNLEYLDHLIGQFMKRLQETGKFDSALIILTSDHSWRKDYYDESSPNLPSEVRHVPLFIKVPGQTKGQQIESKFCTDHLAPILEAAMKGKADEATVLQIIKDYVPKK